MENRVTIRDIKDGQNVRGIYLLKEMNRAETRAGKPYLTLTVMDKTGELTGRIWDDADHWEKQCAPGDIVALEAQAQSYRGNLQLKIISVAREEGGEAALEQFIPASRNDPDEMEAELLDLIKTVADPHIRKLLSKFFKDREFVELFKKTPAAKHMHHAYLGGLLEHTLQVSRLSDMVCRIYPSIDRSLLMAGAMLHDVGKVEELSLNTNVFDYTDQGRLLGHMTLGVEMVQERIRTIKDFPGELAVRIKHLILSHHGRYEFGSPALPMLHEAFVLNFLDDMDAKINYVERLSAGLDEETEYQWSDYQRNLERFLYLSSGTAHPPRDEEQTSGGGRKKKKTPPPSEVKQPSLF